MRKMGGACGIRKGEAPGPVSEDGTTGKRAGSRNLVARTAPGPATEGVEVGKMPPGAPVILLHGFAQTPASWDGVAPVLQSAGHRTFVPDLFVQAPCSLAAVADYVADVVRKVAAVEGVPVLVGYSMGGRLAAEALVRHSDLPLAGLVLESAGLGPADEGARAALAERNAAWAARLRAEGVATFMDWWEALPLFASQRVLPAEVRAELRAEREAHDAEVLACAFEAWGAQRQVAEADNLAALARAQGGGLPVRYIVGALDEKYVALAGRVRAAGIPSAIVEAAGHNVHLERPEAFLAAAGF